MTRVILCLLGLLGAVVAAIAILAVMQPLSWYALAIATVVILAGFVGLHFAATARTPLRPLRLSLGVAIPLNLYFLWGLPFPPHGDAAFPELLLGSCLLIASLIWLWPARRPRLAFVGLAVLGGVALLSIPRMAQLTTAAAASGQYAGPAVALSIVLAAALQTAWLASILHGRALAHPTGHPSSAA